MKKVLIFLFILFCFGNMVNAEQITIKNTQAKNVKEFIIKYALMNNSEIEKDTDYSLVLITDDVGLLARIFYSTKVCNTVLLRTKYAFVNSDKDCVISLKSALVVNPHMAYEVEKPLPEMYNLEILEAIKKRIEGYYSYGINCEKVFGGLRITGFHKDNIAGYKNANISDKLKNIANYDKNIDVKDKIIEIDGQPAKRYNTLILSSILYPSKEEYTGRTLNLKVRRQDKTIVNVELKAKFIPPAK